jgi:hypothetical protein
MGARCTTLLLHLDFGDDSTRLRGILYTEGVSLEASTRRERSPLAQNARDRTREKSVFETYEMNHRFLSHRHVELATFSSHRKDTFTTSRHMYGFLLITVSIFHMNPSALKDLRLLVLRFIDSHISHPPFLDEIEIS